MLVFINGLMLGVTETIIETEDFRIFKHLKVLLPKDVAVFL